VRALREAAHAVGLPDCPDLNVATPIGICDSPYAIERGERRSAADSHLEPARSRSNLAVWPEATVSRLVVEHGRAVAVELERAGDGRRRVYGGTIVLAAGVYHSPQLLMLSGIGRPGVLETIGVAAVHRLDGVGQNYQDHAVADVAYRPTDRLRLTDRIPKIRIIARSRPDAIPDLHLLVRPPAPAGGRPTALPVSVCLLEQRTTGSVTLRSAAVDDSPVVQTGLLRHPQDLQSIVEGIRLFDTIAGVPALAAYYGERSTPRPDANLTDYVPGHHGTYHHGIGTCRMGRADDPGAVVGPNLAVHGIERLWIADASVLPTIPHATTNLAAMLMGELVAKSLS
jgi:choline dehydrogenase